LRYGVTWYSKLVLRLTLTSEFRIDRNFKALKNRNTQIQNASDTVLMVKDV